MPKTAFISGISGFIGSHMSRELQARGYVVEGVDPLGTGLEQGDVLTFFDQSWDDVYDLFIHCAYHVGGRAAIDGVNTNFAKNLQLDAAMFSWAVRTKQKRVLYFSSSAVYPAWLQAKCEYCDDDSCQEGPVTQLHESHADINLAKNQPSNPDAGYGFAKLAGERLAEDARRNGLNVTVVRPASGCSEHQSEDYPWMAIAGRVWRKENPLVIWGEIGQTRDFVHVDDVIGASLAVVDSETTDPVNISTGQPTTMGQLAEMFWLEIHGNLDGFNPVYDTSRPMGVYYRVLDPTKMLGYYAPEHSLGMMVRATAAKLRQDRT